MTNGFFRTRRSVAALWALLCLVAGASPLEAQELRLYVSEDSVTVGQRFYISITAEHEFAADPQFPEFGDSLVFGDVEVLRRHARNSFSRGGARVDSVVYEVTTFALDTAIVAPVPVMFTAGEDTFSIRTPEEFISVTSLVPPETQDVRDLAPLVEFPLPIWPYIAGAAALLLLAALIAFYVIRRRRQPPEEAAPLEPPQPADVEALNRLRALEDADLHQREAAQPFYTELSDTMRHYVARRLHVHAMETTTFELIRELSRKDVPKTDTRKSLQDVLSLADYVKFADAAPAPERGRDALATAREIVRSVETELRPPEPAEPPKVA